MLAGHAVRLAILIALVLFAQVQLALSQKAQIANAKSSRIESIREENHPIDFDLSLPIVNKSASKKDIDWATNFLKLPTWSHGYVSCESPESEISCYELVRAASAIENYQKNIHSKFTEDTIYVEFPPEFNIPLEDKMSMIYHGFLIAMATGRELYANLTGFPFKLPNTIKHSSAEPHGTRIPYDFQLGCANVSSKNPKIVLRGPTWPQVMYTHPVIAPYLRETFSFHAAYFVGNYLFGSTDEPESRCRYSSPTDAVEGWRFYQDPWGLRPHDFGRFLPRCGISPSTAAMVTNDVEASFRDNEFFDRFTINNEEDFICGLRRLVSASHIVHTFGSRLGWWANALQGRKGGFMNYIDNICVNMTNSQQGSLWHTYCPVEKSWIWRTNNRLYVCGPNVNDVRLYLDYLLW